MTKSQGLAVSRRSSSKRHQLNLTRKSVLRMLTIGMSEEEVTDPVKEFITTGRVGRRNALADILCDHALVSTADLPDRLQALSTEDCKPGGVCPDGSCSSRVVTSGFNESETGDAIANTNKTSS